jgi:shikimate O-hydroxycinnamoyltransferase
MTALTAADPLAPPAARCLVHGGSACAPQYLTGLDLLMTNAASPGLLVFPQGLDADALRHSLGRVLKAYPAFTGRLRRDGDGHVFVDCNDAGVAFEVVRHRGAMPAFGQGRPVGSALGRYFERTFGWQVVDRDHPLMSVVLHQFADGGALLSVTATHSLCDGASFWTFMLDWARAHAGQPVPAADMDRNALIRFSTRQPHFEGEADGGSRLVRRTAWLERWQLLARFWWQYVARLDKAVVRISAQQIAAWKDEARRQGGEEEPAGGDLAIAHAVRALSAGMRGTGTRDLGLVTDLRMRRDSGIGRRYVGNALARELVRLGAHEIAESDIGTLARCLRDGLERVGTEDLLADLGLMELHRRRHTVHTLMTESSIRALDSGIVINNCARLPMYRVDLGSGSPSWFETARPPFRNVLLVPTPPGVDGYDLHVTALPHELQALR